MPTCCELTRLEVEELVAGSFLEGAPWCRSAPSPAPGWTICARRWRAWPRGARQRDSAAHFRLPIDRVFSVKGFGTVVTGTLISGAVAKEQEVELIPWRGRASAGARSARSTARPPDRAVAGQRTALNLADIEPAELARGDGAERAGPLPHRTQIDCALELLRSAQPLKHRAPVHFHSGTAEIEAEVRLLDGTAPLARGRRG